MAARSSCPECGTTLRVRDRSFVGRRVSCPECKTMLRVESSDRDDEYLMRRLSTAEIAEVKHGTHSAKSNPGKLALLTESSRSFFRHLNSPLTVAWLLALAVAALFGVLTLGPKVRFTSARTTVSRDLPDLSVQPDPHATPSVKNPVTEGPLNDPVKSEMPADVIVTPSLIDESQSVSALEPVNLDGVLLSSLSMLANHIADIPSRPPAPVKVDVESKLAQKIVSYKQPKVTRRNLIEALQEQLGVPIRYDVQELGEASLDEKVAFELENTTLGEVLEVVAKAAGWQIEIEPTGIRLKQKT